LIQVLSISFIYTLLLCLTTLKKNSICFVDNDTLTWELFSHFLNREKVDSLSVVPPFASGQDFLQYMGGIDFACDILILELKSAPTNGLILLNTLMGRSVDFKIIVVSNYYKLDYCGQVFKLQADAFLPKSTPPGKLLETIEKVIQNEFAWTLEQVNQIRKQIPANASQPSFPAWMSFSKRELEVLELIGQQFTTREIADQLCISHKTVESHRSNLLIKTGVRGAIGLVLFGIVNELIDPEKIVLLEN